MLPIVCFYKKEGDAIHTRRMVRLEVFVQATATHIPVFSNTCLDKFVYTSEGSQQILAWQKWQAYQVFDRNSLTQSNFTVHMTQLSDL